MYAAGGLWATPSICEEGTAKVVNPKKYKVTLIIIVLSYYPVKQDRLNISFLVEIVWYPYCFTGYTPFISPKWYRCLTCRYPRTPIYDPENSFSVDRKEISRKFVYTGFFLIEAII